MKKILHIQVLPKLSGVQKISLEIFKSLPMDRFEKWILFSDNLNVADKDICREAFEESGAKVLFYPNLKRNIGLSDIVAIKEIYRLCKKEKFDVVHTHSTKPGIVGRIAATLARVPLIVHTVHGLSFHKFITFPRWQFYWACEMFASMFCHKIVMVNKYYGKYFKWFKKKTSTIYNGIDFSEFPTYKRVQSDICKVLFVGRLDSPKDPITLLKSAQIVLSQRDNVSFTLVGDGDKYQECKEFIEANNLGKNIQLVGWQNNVAQYYQTHDIFVATSIYESFGLMFVEAGYYKLPVVATNVEGVPEVVANNHTGLLSDPKDVQSIANNILELIDNSSKRVEMGENAHKRVVQLFYAKNMTEQYKKIYNNE